jgi:hypothetical protein
MIFTREEIAEAIEALASADPEIRSEGARRLGMWGGLLVYEIRSLWIDGSSEYTALIAGDETVGIAVTPERFRRIREANGSAPLADVPPDQDAMEFELHFEAEGREGDEDWIPDVHLDILTTRSPTGNGAIAKFLAKNGEGIQQVEFAVSDVDRATQILIEKFGQKPIYPATRPGANGTRVNFFLITNPAGQKVLIELVEPAKPR